MTELEFRTTVVELLSPLAAFPVENKVSTATGTPDVCCSVAWLELKLAEVSRRERVTIKTRESQIIWHRNWRRTGAKSLIMTLADNHGWYLHDGIKASQLNGMSLSDFRITSWTWWSEPPTSQMLVESLIRFK